MTLYRYTVTAEYHGKIELDGDELGDELEDYIMDAALGDGRAVVIDVDYREVEG